MRTLLAMACLVLALPAASLPRAESSGSPGAQSADAIDAPRITQQAFKKLVAANNVVVVDTRNRDAFDQSHMRGALALPLEGRLTWPEEYEKTVAILLKTKKPVVTYCA
jgi:rhodanese-related sulfurtransferase